jgi:hypothetical protein
MLGTVGIAALAALGGLAMLGLGGVAALYGITLLSPGEEQ